MQQSINIIKRGEKFAISASPDAWRDAELILNDGLVSGRAIVEVLAAEVCDIIAALIAATHARASEPGTGPHLAPACRAGMTTDEAMLQGRIAAMARNHAIWTKRYGECSPSDLYIMGFDPSEIRDHWRTIVDRSLVVLEDMRNREYAA